jgi:hypothetical protein
MRIRVWTAICLFVAFLLAGCKISVSIARADYVDGTIFAVRQSFGFSGVRSELLTSPDFGRTWRVTNTEHEAVAKIPKD